MHKLLTFGLASLFLVVTGCQDTPTTVPLDLDPAFDVVGAGHGSLSSFDMSDDLATETTGASGSGKTRVQHSSVLVSVKAKGLLPNPDYELNVTIDFDVALTVTFTATSDKKGKIKFRGDLELDPGTHRLDFFVTHDHPTVPGSGEVGEFVTSVIDRDPLLRCIPFTEVTIL